MPRRGRALPNQPVPGHYFADLDLTTWSYLDVEPWMNTFQEAIGGAVPGQPSSPIIRSSIPLEGLLDGFGLTEEGSRYVMEVASSPPARAVGGHRKRNLIGNVPVPDLGVVLQVESASGEYFFLLEMLWRRDVLAIYDQPTSVPLCITNRSGIATRVAYTPDFLVIHDDGVVAYEAKADGALEALCRQRANDWLQEEDEYVYVPAREHFRARGIKHRVIPGSKTSAIRADNLRTLLTVRQVDDTPRLVRLRERALKIVWEIEVVQIRLLLDRLHIEDVTPILQLVDQRCIHVDLDHCLLSTPADVWVTVDPSLTRLMDSTGFRFKNAIAVQSTVSTEYVPAPQHVQEVASRYAACNLIEPIPDLSQKSERTKRRYGKALREAGGDPAALHPRWARCGNRKARITPAHLQLMHDVIRETKGDSNLSTVANGYLEYRSRWRSFPKNGNDRPVVAATFYRHYNSYSCDADLHATRGGRRASNAAAASIDPLNRTLLPTRVFSIAHIDHYEVDIALLLGRVKRRNITRRVWLTAMVDAYSGEVLGIWLSYNAPSCSSCAMVIRDCAIRHGRLPEILIVDGGKEFDSVHFVTLLATLGITRFQRPPEDPRFGKEVERLFGTFKERFARGLPGFVPGVAYARKASGKFSSAHRARLNFHQLAEMLENYTFDGYNHEPKPDELDSRSAMRAKSDASFPFNGKRVVVDTSFLIQTAVDAPDESYQLAPGRGIRVYGTLYGCHALFSYKGPKKTVRVRIEPFDSSIAYVCLVNTWHVCRSTKAKIHAALPTFEVIARTAVHQQLRSLTKALAFEAELETYEAKRLALASALSRDVGLDKERPAQRMPKATNVSESRRTERVEDIGDLLMDKE